MKKILTILAFFFFSYGFSQTGINYQAIIKNSSGNVYSNATMIVTFSLRYDTSGGSVIYSETHNATSTSEGQISLVVGTGNKTSNGVNFSAIDFSRSIFYTTEVNIGGTGNVSLGTQQLRSVSSAYFAKNAAGISADANNNIIIGTTMSNNVSGTSGVAIGVNALQANTTGDQNHAVGYNALSANTTGIENVAFGYAALSANTSGEFNVGLGNHALQTNTTGDNNTAVGYAASEKNTTGDNNSAFGIRALRFNTTGVLNTAIGSRAMRVNVTGSSNTALGNEALTLNTTGSENTALGVSALTANSTGTQNVAVGKDALYNSDGNRNTAVGYKSLYANTNGSENTALGYKSLSSITNEPYNVAIGAYSLENLANPGSNQIGNVAIGVSALNSMTLGNGNVAVGTSAGGAGHFKGGTTAIGANSNAIGNNSTAIGSGAIATATNTIQLGNSAITDVITSGTVSTTGGVLTSGTVTATSFVGDGSGLTNLPSSSLNASTTDRLSEIFIQPHEVTTNTSVSYPPGYSINLIPFPEGTGTVMGGVLIPLMMPSNWNRGNVTVTFYYSCSAADGNIRFNTGARRYGTGDVNITYPVSPFYLTPSAAWTLNKHTYTQSVGDYSANSVDDSILIINFSRYAYQPQTYGDTNTGDMYIHGIRIAYSTN
ncbi:MAG: beta strand repeat-containing protein [Flavobacteriaceae bacterium]